MVKLPKWWPNWTEERWTWFGYVVFMLGMMALGLLNYVFTH
jgi:hypothetical protein